MTRHVFPIAIISLATPFTFVALQAPRLAQTPFALTSQHMQQDPGEAVPDSCPVTKPSAHPFVPPLPYPREVSAQSFWFGTDKLWTRLPTTGTWTLRHYRPADTAFRQKLFWWREGYDWRSDSEPMLTITGKRLDSTAPPLGTDQHANAGWGDDKNHAFIVAGIFIPTTGCWEVTGNFEDAKLTYVIRVTQ